MKFKAVNLYRKNGEVISIPSESLVRLPRIKINKECKGIDEFSIDFVLDKNVKYNWKREVSPNSNLYHSILSYLQENRDIQYVELETPDSRYLAELPTSVPKTSRNSYQKLYCLNNRKNGYKLKISNLVLEQ